MPFDRFLRSADEIACTQSDAIERAEYLVRKVYERPFLNNRPSAISNGTSSSQSDGTNFRKSLQQKLEDLYRNEGCHPQHPEFRTDLLRRLMEKEKLNCLILNLHPGDIGLSVAISGREGTTQPVLLPYEDVWLTCIDRGELHPDITDLLVGFDIFYDGCIIVEVRDHRRSAKGEASQFDSKYILLKPTVQTLVSDLRTLAPEKSREWTWEDRQQLEATLLLLTSGPLCLEPNPSVAVVANRLQYRKNFLHSHSLKRMASKHGQIRINKRKRFEALPSPPYLQFYDYLKKHKKDFTKPVPKIILPPCDIRSPHMDDFKFSAENFSIVQKCISSVRNTPSLPKEYREICKEISRNPGDIQCARITVTEVPEDGIFYVTQYLSRKGHDKTSSSFPLGSKESVIKYIDQFTETFTEKGRIAVESQPKVVSEPNSSSVLRTLANATSVSSIIPTKAPSNFTIESIMSSSKTSNRSVDSPHHSETATTTKPEEKKETSKPQYSRTRGVAQSSVRSSVLVSPTSNDSVSSEYSNVASQDTVIFSGSVSSTISNVSPKRNLHVPASFSGGVAPHLVPSGNPIQNSYVPRSGVNRIISSEGPFVGTSCVSNRSAY